MTTKPLLSILASVTLTLGALSPLCAIGLDEVMNAALAKDSTLADARSKLAIAENNLVKSSALYKSSLSLSGTVSDGSSSTGSAATAGTSSSGTSASTTTGDMKKSVSANLSVPLVSWLTVGATATTDTKTNSAGLSLSLVPFAAADTSAEVAWNKAVIEAESAARTTILSVRREYRAVLTAKAEVGYRTAAVQTAQNELSRIQYLVELGKERKSKEISAYSELISAQSDLDTAQVNLTTARQNLSLRSGIAEESLVDLDALSIAEGRTFVDEEAWLASSAELATAKIALLSVESARKKSLAVPDLSLSTSVSDSLSWSVTAKVSISPDVIFQKSASTAGENLAIQQRSYANTERSVRTAWQNQQNALAKAKTNYENAARFIESAELSYTETELLLQKGEASQSTLDSSNENLLSARYQLQKAVESLENARDQLDSTWQLGKMD